MVRATRRLSAVIGSAESDKVPFDIHVLFNPVNQGYGGNQKLGYHYAVEHGYDLVALLHGDGQYVGRMPAGAFERFPESPGRRGFWFSNAYTNGSATGWHADVQIHRQQILTYIENKLLGIRLSEFHSGYRLYAVPALKAIPFERNSNGFHFDTEIIIQLVAARIPITELPIPTYYGGEICRVNGLKYALDVVKAVLICRMQQMNLFYDVRFDCAPDHAASPYTLKLNFTSPHRLALDTVRPGAAVVDLGCAGGYMGGVLKRQKQCYVAGVDIIAPEPGLLDTFYAHDLNRGLPDIRFEDYDYTLLLDVIEHLQQPDDFLVAMRSAVARNPKAEILISTGNVAFIVVRLMLLMGQFNYGKRGILDLTHGRLFTFGSFRRSLEQAGFVILETKGVPAPFPLAIGDNAASRFLLTVNRLLIALARGLFAYQIFMRIKPRPSLEVLLQSAHERWRSGRER